MKRLKVVPVELIEKFLQDIDPFNNQKVMPNSVNEFIL